MLVLARKIGEKIIINDNIEITVLDSNQNSVRIGISAPKNVSVYREELYKDIKNTNKISNEVSTTTINELTELLKERKTKYLSSNFEKLTNKIDNE